MLPDEAGETATWLAGKGVDTCDEVVGARGNERGEVTFSCHMAPPRLNASKSDAPASKRRKILFFTAGPCAFEGENAA